MRAIKTKIKTVSQLELELKISQKKTDSDKNLKFVK